MKKLITLSLLIAIVSISILNIIGCKTAESIQAKSGAELWGENCVRCHNAPSPDAFSDSQWNVIGTHMKIRAYLTDDEVNKITEFLKSAN